MLVGTAAADITPPIGTPLQGHFSAHPESHGILAPLEIRTVVFQASPEANSRDSTSPGNLAAIDSLLSQIVVIITADLIAVPLDLTQRVRKSISDKHGIAPQNILIAASHTHCGPATLPSIGLAPQPEILKAIEEKFLASVDEAIGRLEPVTLGIGVGAAHFNINRRPWAGTAAMAANDAGVVDKRVRMLRVDRADGSPLAVLFHYSCHPTAKNGSDGLISPDYPGLARARIEKELNCRAAFLPGCFGNIRPKILEANGKFASATAEQVAAVGDELADAVITAAKYVRTMNDDRLAAVESEVFFPFGDAPTADEIHEMSRRLDQPLRADWATRQLESRGLSRSPGTPGEGRGEGQSKIQNPKSKIENDPPLSQHRERGPDAGEASIMQALRVGPIVLVGVPGEPAQEIGYAIERAGARGGIDVWAMGYCNDQIGYLCTPRMYPEGGYEPTAYVVYDRPAPYCDEQRIILHEADKLLKSLSG